MHEMKWKKKSYFQNIHSIFVRMWHDRIYKVYSQYYKLETEMNITEYDMKWIQKDYVYYEMKMKW